MNLKIISKYLLLLLYNISLSDQANVDISHLLYEHRGRNIKLDGTEDNYVFIQEENTKHRPGYWPWVCSIGAFVSTKTGPRSWSHSCVGIIASERHVITTAGCMDECKYMVYGDTKECELVRVGHDHFLDPRNKDDVEIMKISSIKRHDLYNKIDYNGYHDFAILKLEKTLTFSTYIRPIALPEIIDGKIILNKREDSLQCFSYWGSHNHLVTSYIVNKPMDICNLRSENVTFNTELSCGNDPRSPLKRICDITHKYKEVDYGGAVVKLDREIGRYVLNGLITIDYNDQESCDSKSKPNMIVSMSKKNLQFIFHELYNATLEEEDIIIHYITTTSPKTDEDNLIYENCGQNNILDGKSENPSSQLEKYPWQVSIGQFNPRNPEEWNHFCGGSVVTTTKIVTAAHCVSRFKKLKSSIKIRAGDDKLHSKNDDSGVQTIPAENLIIHEKFSKRYNDIGIVTLASPLKITRFVRPICLLSSTEVNRIEKREENNLPIIVTGWGAAFNIGSYKRREQILRDTLAEVLPEKYCNETYKDSRVSQSTVPNLFTSNLFCADDPAGDAGTCQGDSGGSAIHLNEKMQRYYLQGVVSGSGLGQCGTNLFPNIYTRTTDPDTLKWIKEKIQEAPAEISIEIEPDIHNNQIVQYSCSVDSYPVSSLTMIIKSNMGQEIKSVSVNSNRAYLALNKSNIKSTNSIQCTARNNLGRTEKEKLLTPHKSAQIEENDASQTVIIITTVVLVLVLLIIIVVTSWKKRELLSNTFKFKHGKQIQTPGQNFGDDYFDGDYERVEPVEHMNMHDRHSNDEVHLDDEEHQNCLDNERLPDDEVIPIDELNPEGNNNTQFPPNSVESRLCEKFSRIRINEEAVNRSQVLIKNQKSEKFNEKAFCTFTKGISRDNIDKVINQYSKSLALPKEMDKKLRAYMGVIKYSTQTTDNPYEVDCKLSTYKSVYGFLCMAEESDGTISIACAIHKLEIKLSDKEVRFTTDDIEDMKMHYCKFKALEYLRSEGLIQGIKYEH